MALIVAQHARWLYTHVGQENVEDQRSAIDFVASLSGRITACLAAMKAGGPEEKGSVEPHALERFRSLLSLFDRISLSLVGGLPWEAPDEAVAFGGCTARLTLEPVATGVRMRPWPFFDGDWHLLTTGRTLPRRTFDSASTFDQQFHAAGEVVMSHRILDGSAIS